MAESAPFELTFRTHRKRLPALPGQSEGTSYGVIWGGCPLPADGSCYVVEFCPESDSQVSIIAYVNKSGGVYQVDRPITLAPDDHPDFVVVPDESGHAGTVCVRDPAPDNPMALKVCGRYRGSFVGTMREVGESVTWNTEHSLTYRPFMASMFLRYCVFDAARPSLRPHQTVDLTPIPLERPIRLFEGFGRTPLPDALDALIYRIDAAEAPSGIERFARRVLGAIDSERLRQIITAHEVHLAHIARMDGFYLNFDRAALDAEDAVALMVAETAINRVYQVLVALGAGLGEVVASPSEEACSIFDQRALYGVSSWVACALERALAPNEWSCPGSRSCVPGGEWDVRTRFTSLCEQLNLVVRFEYDMRCCAAEGVMQVRFIAPVGPMMPRSWFVQDEGAWHDATASECATMARECAARMVLVAAAVAFSSSLMMRRVYVEEVDLDRPDRPIVFEFDRTTFTSSLAPLAAELEGKRLVDPVAAERLSPFMRTDPVPDVVPAAWLVPPVQDDRPIPPALVDLVQADFVRELEVMEDPDDPAMKRFTALRELEQTDPRAALEGLSRLVDELEASSAAAELLSAGPLVSRFCENHLGRILLPLLDDDPELRYRRAPDALYFAQHEICQMYQRLGDFDRALREARKLLDMGPTAMQAHFALVNVLARLERFDEVIEVCRHGLRIAYDRESISYLYYRLAFALWRQGDRESALACYRLMPPQGEMADAAAVETRALMAEMGLTEEPSLASASALARRAGIPVAPTPAVSERIADVAVLCADNGLFFLASRCVYHLWRINRADELGVVQRSLMPPAPDA